MTEHNTLVPAATHDISASENAPVAPQRKTAMISSSPRDAQAIFEQAGIVDDLARVEALLLERTASRSPLIAAAGAHTVHAGGKRLRAALVILAGKLGQYHFDQVLHPAASAELIHAASLIHDDLVDQAAQRRGRTTVHARWDNDVALMVGDYFFALAANEMALSPDPRIISFYAQAVQTIVEGELSPVTLVEPFNEAIEQYIYKTGSKTASLFEAACKAGITATGGNDEQIAALGQFGYNFGVAFQIMDDILDFSGDQQLLGKPAGNDLRQGTITLPLIHAVAESGSDYLRSFMNQPHPTDDQVQRAIDEVRRYKGVELALTDAHTYVEKALHCIQPFVATVAHEYLMDLTYFIINRQS